MKSTSGFYGVKFEWYKVKEEEYKIAIRDDLDFLRIKLLWWWFDFHFTSLISLFSHFPLNRKLLDNHFYTFNFSLHFLTTYGINSFIFYENKHALKKKIYHLKYLKLIRDYFDVERNWKTKRLFFFALFFFLHKKGVRRIGKASMGATGIYFMFKNICI